MSFMYSSCVCVLINQLLFLSSTLHPMLVLLLEVVVGFRAMYTVLRGSYAVCICLSKGEPSERALLKFFKDVIVGGGGDRVIVAIIERNI